jgi:hypothetical protein
MKSTLQLILILFLALPALAEPPDEDILRPRIPTRGDFFVGFDVGLNTTWFDGNPIYRAFFPSEQESPLFRSAFGFEPFGSLYFGMRVTPDVRLRARFDYDVRTADRKGTTIDSCPLVDAVTGERIGNVPVEVEKEYKLSISYLTVALIGEYRLGQAFIYAGPAWSKPIKRSFAEDDRILDEASFCVYFAETGDSTREIRAELDGVENVASVIGVKVGVGYEIEMASDLVLVPQVGIDLPLSSALQSDEPFAFRAARSGADSPANTTRLNQHMFFRALQASIGLRYSF